MSKQLVIVGNSAAALSAIESIRRTNKNSKIRLVCGEQGPPYSRVLTSYYLAGSIAKENTYLHDMDFYEKYGVDPILGHRAVGLEPAEKYIKLDDDRELEYDRLLIATGASPNLPEMVVNGNQGIFGLRTLQDATDILVRTKRSTCGIVLGGGPVGLKAAWALRKRGLAVTIIVGSDHLLSQMVSSECGHRIGSILRNQGYKVLTGAKVGAIRDEDAYQEVETENGQVLPTDMVVIGKGIRPNVEWLQGSGVALEWGVLVDDKMATNLPDIYAAGDVVQGYDRLAACRRVAGLWSVAVTQGRVAGLNMTGCDALYPGYIRMNVLDLPEMTVASVGITVPQAGDEVITSTNKESYSQLVIRGNHLVGGVFLNDYRNKGIFHSIINNRISLDKLPPPAKLMRLNHLRLWDLGRKLRIGGR